MKVTPLAIPEVLLIEPTVLGDSRGYFLETYSVPRYTALGLPAFVQDNLSRSAQGVLRGMHLQEPYGQGKLISVLFGEVYDVAVDVRWGSPTFGKWVALVLSQENKRQMYVPPGFAHGFCVTSELALFSYKCSELYHPECEIGVAYNDPAFNISWPVPDPQISQKDAANLRLCDIPKQRLPQYR